MTCTWQGITKDAPRLAREPDFVEQENTLRELSQSQQYALIVATEPLAQLSLGWQPPQAASVSFLGESHILCFLISSSGAASLPFFSQVCSWKQGKNIVQPGISFQPQKARLLHDSPTSIVEIPSCLGKLSKMMSRHLWCQLPAELERIQGSDAQTV